MKYYISEANWSTILSFLKAQKGLHTSNEPKLRIFIEAVYYILKTGGQWMYIPKCYGCGRAIHKRYKNWADKGVWGDLMTYVADKDTQQVMMDSLSVKAHACASGYEINGNEIHALGRSVGGFTTKIHTLTDALGNPIRFILTPGNTHDIIPTKDLLEGIRNSKVLADKAYFSEENIEFITGNCNEVVIPSKSNYTKDHSIDWHVYKERHLIENFFSKIKHFRRVFSRFDKTCSAFLGFISLASTFIWLR